MGAKHVLIVDDDEQICSVLREFLSEEGLRVSIANNIVGARDAAARDHPDICIVDLRLGSEDGLDLVRELKPDRSIGVIILTGKGDTTDKIVGLEVGADDYLIKPFDQRELLARIRSVLRRLDDSQSAPAKTVAPRALEFAGFRFDPIGRRLTAPDGGDTALTSFEFDLLRALLKNANQAVSRDELYAAATNGRERDPLDRSVDVHVVKLRQKIEPDPDNPSIIKSVRGVGYVIAVEINPVE